MGTRTRTSTSRATPTWTRCSTPSAPPRRDSRPHLPGRAGAAQSDVRAGGRLPRAQRRPRRRHGARPPRGRAPGRRGSRRRCTGRRRGSTFWCSRRTPPGPGRFELEDRELPRLSHRHLGSGARRPRAFTQAEKFGSGIAIARPAVKLRCQRRPFAVEFSTGEVVHARAIVIASGARYRKPPLKRLEAFEGAGIYHAATPMEAAVCGGEEVIVVGGGNSAGQAAVLRRGHSPFAPTSHPPVASTRPRPP